MYIPLLDNIKREAASGAAAGAASAVAQAKEAATTYTAYNASALALSYGFVDYFDDRSFGDANINGPTNVNPSTLGSSSQLATATPFIVTIAIAALMLRFFSRTRFNARMSWDDLFAVLAGILLIADQLIFTRIVFLGRANLDTMLQTTQQFEAEREARITTGLKLFMAFELIYIFSSFFIKYSFLFLYLRISQETKTIKWFVRGAFVVTTLAFIFCILALFLTCTPISDFWDVTDPTPSCEKKSLLTYGTGISNIVTDLMVLAILIPLLLQASLSKSQIKGVVAIYACGGLVIVASCLSLATQVMAVSMLQSMGWALIETSLALILLCAPMGGKLLAAPLIPEGGYPMSLKRGNFDRRYSTSPFDKNLPIPPPALLEKPPMHLSNLGYNPRDSVMSQDTTMGGPVSPPRGPIVREVDSPFYKKLKLGTRESTNGRTVWEIQQRLSATTATETSYGPPSRSPTVAGLTAPPQPPPMDWPVRG
ncbi:hypothetical protein H072_8697 [Dactylellina haptotyla CBS 200.50]|uniref:Rhodopsin domain-containing protein n=1 Tax=Dactylellina haptotyla (strain CBS 200.50) TaxID=1284197 RepID=S8A907_DACHA|nr:hypothetical protein H072_8697 [Dactylellina haptotyla CBS 200.50]